MTPITDEVSAASVALRALEPLRLLSTSCVDPIGGELIIDVAVDHWASAADSANTAGLHYFDFLTAYVHDDQLDVLVHLCAPSVVHGLFIRTHVPSVGSLATLTSIYPGANWHERESAEMFGLAFDGHPDPRHMLLPDDFQGHPLLKSYALNPRVNQPWPGEVEPADPNARPRTRRKSLPPGVLAEWSMDDDETPVTP